MLLILSGLIIFIVIIILVLLVYVIKTYNNFVTLGERVTNGKAQIATQIESRWDALTNLINATKKYADYEAKALEDIISKRLGVSEDSSVQQLEQNEEQLNNVLGRLIAISESYPDLKASEVYTTTMEKVDKYENNVRHARMIYNDVVTRFNRLVRMFPSNFIAKMFGFKQKEYFQGTESKAEMPSWE